MKTIATKSKALGKKRPPGYLQGREHERAAVVRELRRWVAAFDSAGGALNEYASAAMARRADDIERGNHL